MFSSTRDGCQRHAGIDGDSLTTKVRAGTHKRGPGRPTSADSTATRARILDAALLRFSSGGFGSTSISALAADAGVTSGLLYYYFGSKSGLFSAVGEAARGQLDEKVIAPILALVAEHSSLETRLITLVTFLAHRAEQDSPLHRLILRRRRRGRHP